eukprot:9482373-Pyramimonas_sp.AAC.1
MQLDKHARTQCAARYTRDGGGHLTLDQDDYIKQLRSVQYPEPASADADAKAPTTVTDMLVSLGGALACVSITQELLM